MQQHMALWPALKSQTDSDDSAGAKEKVLQGLCAGSIFSWAAILILFDAVDGQ